MYCTPNKERLKKLDLSEAKIGNSILFCENCIFQINASVFAMKNECPDCHSKPLYLTTVDKELVDLVENYQRIKNGYIGEHENKETILKDKIIINNDKIQTVITFS